MSTVMVRIINTEVFICDLATAGPKAYRPRFCAVRNEPTLNTQDGAKRLIAAQIGHLGRVSIGNSAQYQYGNKHDGERHANRLRNRALIAHNHLSPQK